MDDTEHTAERLQPRLNVITLGVDDLEASLAFYRDGLGLPTTGIVGSQYAGDAEHPAGAAVMFHLEHGLVLSLYPRSELAKDAGVPADRTAGSGHSVGYFVERREDVDAVLALARSAGAGMHGPAHERPWGIYSGYFSDPDGHMWEVICPLERGETPAG